jgi:hypothetical protein
LFGEMERKGREVKRLPGGEVVRLKFQAILGFKL